LPRKLVKTLNFRKRFDPHKTCLYWNEASLKRRVLSP
jgi:hypothetical protein